MKNFVSHIPDTVIDRYIIRDNAFFHDFEPTLNQSEYLQLFPPCSVWLVSFDQLTERPIGVVGDFVNAFIVACCLVDSNRETVPLL